MRKDHWVILKGLKPIKDLVVRATLIKAVKEFFHSWGIRPKSVVVFFSSGLPKTLEFITEFGNNDDPWDEDLDDYWFPFGDMKYMPVSGDYNPQKENQVKVYPRRIGRESGKNAKLEILRTLFHELDHLLWKLEGREFENHLPYRKRPHEIRAFKVQETELKRQGFLENRVSSLALPVS